MPSEQSFDIHASSVELDEPLLTPSAAAALLAVRTSWIYDAARSGHLPSLRVGKHVRFLRSDLEQWVADMRAIEGRASGRPTTRPRAKRPRSTRYPGSARN